MNDVRTAPKISILIPVFNRQKYIAECIQSALNQSFEDFEIVVVDNASDDGTWVICQEIALSDARVRVFRNETNIGPVRNWIRCASEAKGVFSKMLFSDDCLEPNCLSEMEPKLDDPNVAFVFCAARIGKSREDSEIAYAQSDSSRLSSVQLLNLVLTGKAPVSPGAVLIRTVDLLQNLHVSFPTSTQREFGKNGAGPDVMVMLLTSRRYKFVANVSAPLVYFRVHAGSFSIENAHNSVVSGYRSVIALFLIENHGRKAWMKYMAHCWLHQIRVGHAWRNPISHLREYEGHGSLREVFDLLVTALFLVLNKLLNGRIVTVH